jgi:hypothetical protein
MTRSQQILDIITYGMCVAFWFEADSANILMNKVYMYSVKEWLDRVN